MTAPWQRMLRDHALRDVARILVCDAGEMTGDARALRCAWLYGLREYARLVVRDGGLSRQVSEALHYLETHPRGGSPTCP